MQEFFEHNGPETGEPTAFCPSDASLAAWFDARLEETRRPGLQQHVAQCTWCRGRTGMLARLQGDATEIEISPELLAAAKRLSSRNGRQWRRAPAWAAAAMVILAVGILIGQQQSLQLAMPGDTVDPVRQVRSVDHASYRLEFTSPAPDSQVKPAPLTVEWTAVPGSLYYEVTLLDESGDLLARERVDGTAWRSPDTIRLQAGAEYFVQVTANLANATSVRSDYLALRVEADD